MTGRFRAAREAIRLRLATVTALPFLQVIPTDGLGEEITGNTITIGTPRVGFTQGSPYEADSEIGGTELEARWPIVLYIARDQAMSTSLLDDAIEDVTLALLSDPTLGGTTLAMALDSVEPSDDDPDQPARHHILAWELVAAMHIREGGA